MNQSKQETHLKLTCNYSLPLLSPFLSSCSLSCFSRYSQKAPLSNQKTHYPLALPHSLSLSLKPLTPSPASSPGFLPLIFISKKSLMAKTSFSFFPLPQNNPTKAPPAEKRYYPSLKLSPALSLEKHLPLSEKNPQRQLRPLLQLAPCSSNRLQLFADSLDTCRPLVGHKKHHSGAPTANHAWTHGSLRS